MTTQSKPDTADDKLIIIRSRCDCGRDITTYFPPTQQPDEEDTNDY